MCASAIRWAGFKEYIYGTTIQHNYNAGWGVITMSSYDVFQQTRQLPGFQTLMLGQILKNETDPLFSWQYNVVSLFFRIGVGFVWTECSMVSNVRKVRSSNWLTYLCDRLRRVRIIARGTLASREDMRAVLRQMRRSRKGREQLEGGSLNLLYAGSPQTVSTVKSRRCFWELTKVIYQ